MAIEIALSCTYPKLYFARLLEGYVSPYDDPFEYRSILHENIPDAMFSEVLTIGAEQFHAVTDPIVRGKHYLDVLRKHADKAYEPRYWWLAYLDDEPVGLVFPQFIPDLEKVGSVWHIGIRDKFRGRGYGRVIHARALETLSRLGATRYLGSTQPDNFAMIKVFEANGCNYKNFRIIEEFTNGDGRALD